jgi:MOSC domain-containing protein YiiM
MQQGHVVGIFFSLEANRPSKFTQQAILMGSYGLQGDRHAKEGVDNQLLLVDVAVLEDLDLKAGAIFENFTIRGLKIDEMKPGTRLRMGETAIIEISRICKPCKRMNEVRDGLMKKLAGRRGMYARVIRGGQVFLQDAVIVQSKEAEEVSASDFGPTTDPA